MTWRVAKSLLALRAEVDRTWPKRDHTSDGTIGNAEHASRHSDHNPWVHDSAGVGVVRALDTDSDGIPCAAYAEHIRQLGASGDPRLNPDGYVIYKRRIASAAHGWVWREYTGPNPHLIECHVSVTTRQAGYDSTAGWGISALASRPATHKAAAKPVPAWYRRPLRPGMSGDDVKAMQLALKVKDHRGRPVRDGIYSPGGATERAVNALRAKRGWAQNSLVDRNVARLIGG